MMSDRKLGNFNGGWQEIMQSCTADNVTDNNQALGQLHLYLKVCKYFLKVFVFDL